jgi:fructoselysine-6-P-deglycase FrlB-like protein
MNELFRSDIFDQSIAAKKTRAFLSESIKDILADQNFRRIVFSGSGDSYFAGYSLQYAARKYQSREVYAVMSNEAAHYWRFDKGDLLIPISISGESEKTIHAVNKAQEANATVLPITSNKDSRLAQLADNIVLIPHQSVSRRTPHSTDYMTTLIAIASIIEAISEKPIPLVDQIYGIVETILDNLEDNPNVFSLGKNIKGVNILGGGPNYGTAQYGAAKFWEAGGSKAAAFEIEEVGHGPFMSFRPDELVVLIMPEGNSYKKGQLVLKGIETLGFETLIITNSNDQYPTENVIRLPKIDELWSPIATCIPLQYLCYTFANYWKIDVSNSERFSPEVFQKAFSYFRSADFEKLYK